MVVRQWVHDTPSLTLAQQLAGKPEWRRQVRAIGGLVDRGVPLSDVSIARRLQDAGLPHTPATIQHLRGVVAEKDEPLPAHGLLVTTRVYIHVVRHLNADRFAGDFRPPHQVSITGWHGHETTRLWAEAVTVAHAHRAWLADLRCPDLAHLSTIVRSIKRPEAKTGLGTVNYDLLADKRVVGWLDRRRHTAAHHAAGPAQFDYLAQATREPEFSDFIRQLQRTHEAERPHAVAVYTKRIQDRVAQARKRAGIVPTPDRGWRTDLRRRIEAALEDRSVR
jgi:hypothetical protein